MDLRDQAQQCPPAEHRRAVEELLVVPHRHPHHRQQIQVLAALQERAQGVFRALQQRILQKEIPAGIAGQAQLRQTQNLDPFRRRLMQQGKAGLGVVGAVGHPDLRGSGGDFDETILHGQRPP